MMPHALFGIRVRGKSGKNRSFRFESWGGGSGGGGKSFGRGTLGAIVSILQGVSMSSDKVPFYKRIYSQGRKG